MASCLTLGKPQTSLVWVVDSVFAGGRPIDNRPQDGILPHFLEVGPAAEEVVVDAGELYGGGVGGSFAVQALDGYV
jgi:hypothetical protein